jgi:hypothetical protein
MPDPALWYCLLVFIGVPGVLLFAWWKGSRL